MIDGVQIVPLRQIVDERGQVMHMLRADAPHFQEFGEIYFATVNPGAIKGWHIHTGMTLNYAVHRTARSSWCCMTSAMARPRAARCRSSSWATRNYVLVRIPPKVWNGVKGFGADALHHRQLRQPSARSGGDRSARPVLDEIPYDWSLRHG